VSAERAISHMILYWTLKTSPSSQLIALVVTRLNNFLFILWCLNIIVIR